MAHDLDDPARRRIPRRPGHDPAVPAVRVPAGQPPAGQPSAGQPSAGQPLSSPHAEALVRRTAGHRTAGHRPVGPADTGAVRAAAPAQNPAWAAPRAGTQPWPPTAPPTSRPSNASPRGRRTTASLVVGLVAVVVAVGLLLGGVFSRPSAAGTTTGPIPAAGPVPAPGPATHLDDGLSATLDEAAADAARDGVELTLTSGWRSVADQQGLVDAALERYGSVEAARRWVLPPEASAHVAGLAIDVGPTEGALWLGERSERYGLCRTYANEVWHFEPVIERGGTCPSMHEDASDGWAGHA